MQFTLRNVKIANLQLTYQPCRGQALSVGPLYGETGHWDGGLAVDVLCYVLVEYVGARACCAWRYYNISFSREQQEQQER